MCILSLARSFSFSLSFSHSLSLSFSPSLFLPPPFLSFTLSLILSIFHSHTNTHNTHINIFFFPMNSKKILLIIGSLPCVNEAGYSNNTSTNEASYNFWIFASKHCLAFDAFHRWWRSLPPSLPLSVSIHLSVSLSLALALSFSHCLTYIVFTTLISLPFPFLLHPPSFFISTSATLSIRSPLSLPFILPSCSSAVHHRCLEDNKLPKRQEY